MNNTNDELNDDINNNINNVDRMNKNIDNKLLIDEYAQKLNIYNGDNFYVILNEYTNNIIILINHFFIDGVSWRLLLDKIEDKNLYEELERYDIWTNELYNIKYGDISNEYNFWNDIHKNIPFFLYDIKYNNISKNMYSIENEEQEHILININDKYINRDIVLKNLVLTLLEIYNINQIAINIETHGREDITFNNNIYNIFGWFTSYFPYIFNYENINNLHDIFNKDIHKNGIYYLLLKYNYFKNYKLIEEKNKVEILFNYMGDFKSSYSNFKLLDIGEKGDCGHCISFWFSILNDNHDKYLNINISYLRNFIHKQTIINIINKLSHRLLNY